MELKLHYTNRPKKPLLIWEGRGFRIVVVEQVALFETSFTDALGSSAWMTCDSEVVLQALVMELTVKKLQEVKYPILEPNTPPSENNLPTCASEPIAATEDDEIDF